MEADIMAQLSPEEANKFREAYAAMPDYAKKGFLEYVSSGGQAITDQATNIAMSQNKELESLIKGTYANIKDAGTTTSQVQTEVLKQVTAVGEEQRRVTKEAGGGIIGMANRLGASGLDQISSMFNAMVSSGLYSKESVDKSRENAQAMAKLNDKLLHDLTKFQDNVQNYSVTMSSQLGSFIKPFTDAITFMTKAMNNFVVLTTQGVLGKAPPAGSPPGTPATEPYSKKQYVEDMKLLAKEVLVPVLKEIKDWMKVGTGSGYAGGGIASGPNSGFMAKLHGTEAVIPLADGSVPVQLSGNVGGPDLSGMMQIMQASYAAAIKAASQTNYPDAAAKNTNTEQIKELPEALTAALATVLSGPTGLSELMAAVKTQIAEDNRTQTSMLQQQIDNLVKLVDAMNDNVRYSERIANELA
jgi:gas vesicle protein